MDATRRRLGAAALAALALAAAARPALAHGGSLRSAPARDLAVPPWLLVATGGGVVGASFLLSTFVTDRSFVEAVHEWRRTARPPAVGALRAAGRVAGVLALVGVVAVGLVGPRDPLRNAAVLVVWVGWWAGVTASAYLLGNAWPALNPWRTLAGRLPTLGLSYPDRLGAWPAVAGLLGLVWLEVVSPLADAPRLLAAVVLGYTAVTLAGAVAVGAERWFGSVDPVARVFRCYGRVAPLARDRGEGLRARLPGAGLTRTRLDGHDEVAFVVALLWVTTYDGLVTTAAWRAVATAAVGAGVPAVVLYPVALLAGFGAFLGAYLLAVRYGRRFAETYRDTAELARRFAPSLLAIAAGYHLAHFLGYLLELAPALVGALANPLAPPAARTLVLPGWFGGLELGFVLAGHLLAVWVAHATAYDLFPSRLQAIRSQYALTAVMVAFTVTGLWIVSRPYVEPPFV